MQADDLVSQLGGEFKSILHGRSLFRCQPLRCDCCGEGWKGKEEGVKGGASGEALEEEGRTEGPLVDGWGLKAGRVRWPTGIY